MKFMAINRFQRPFFGDAEFFLEIFKKNLKKLLTNGFVCDIINHVVEIVAQLAEHTPFKRRVEGSNPSYLTNIFISSLITYKLCN